MPKISKGKKARMNNLSKATEALTLKRSQTNTPTPEGTPEGTPLELDSPTQTFPELEPTSLDDTPGSRDSLLGDEFPDVECTELQEEGEDEEDMELNSETALASFAEFLLDAQIAERPLEQEAGRKRKRKGYTGHSRQTAQRRKQAEIKMRDRATQKSNLSLEVQGRLQRQSQSPHPAKKLQRFPQTLRMTLRVNQARYRICGNSHCTTFS
ncbi:hypothetical protein C8R44DRAFT_757692 [Mycena epipterygia]|nr:hypothetical protein C8R44DRAFT_757692 [Mycena epipterygia]